MRKSPISLFASEATSERSVAGKFTSKRKSRSVTERQILFEKVLTEYTYQGTANIVTPDENSK
ncbi:MAG: hypothetical protein KBS53_04930 [Bacteroidales bacterium]|nr:hypothetical protein [Candidatus Hennigimonas equi]